MMKRVVLRELYRRIWLTWLYVCVLSILLQTVFWWSFRKEFAVSEQVRKAIGSWVVISIDRLDGMKSESHTQLESVRTLLTQRLDAYERRLGEISQGLLALDETRARESILKRLDDLEQSLSTR